MVVEMAVGLRAKAAVQSCTVCISMWRMVAVEGRHGSCEVASLPRMAIRACTGLESSVAASSDSGAGFLAGTACTHIKQTSVVPLRAVGQKLAAVCVRRQATV